MEIGFLICFLLGGVVGFFVCDKGKKKIKAKLADVEKKYDEIKAKVKGA